MTTGREVQLILLGESGVGKTSLLLRFVSGTFRESLQRTRIDRCEKPIKIKDKEINLVIWDTAGQEMYNSLVRNYYTVADGVLLVYDVRNADTFIKLSKWLLDLKSMNEKAQVVIAGNKIEDRSMKAVNVSVVSEFARVEQLEHVGVSAKSGENVEILFHHLVKKILASRGVLSYSRNRELERLEGSGEYISPSTVVPERAPDSPATPENDPADGAATSRDASGHARDGLAIVYDSGTEGSSQGLETNECNDVRRVPRADTPSEESLYEMCDFPDDESTDSADCALDFFDALGEDIFRRDGDVIRLHDAEDRRVKKGCC